MRDSTHHSILLACWLFGFSNFDGPPLLNHRQKKKKKKKKSDSLHLLPFSEGADSHTIA
jgi:hypothetical protein